MLREVLLRRQLIARLQASLEGKVADPTVPSAIARIEIGSKAVFSGAAGSLSDVDSTPVRPDTPFRIASVGKLFTAVAVLRLVERGQLGLDATLGALLPAVLVDRLHVLQGVSRGRQLTVRQLLGHTTGLANIDSDPTFNGLVAQNPSRVWRPQDLLEFCIAIGPQFAPGEGQLYSSPNYTLLGMVIEAATGKPYHRVVREEVLDRLGMQETYEETSEGSGPKPLAHSFIGPLDVNLAHPSFEFADGGFVSTTADLCRFGRAFARSRLFERAETQAAMLQSQGAEDVGLGPWTSRVLLRGGPALIAFHPGYWGVMLLVVPERDATIAFTINQSEAETSALLADFLEAI